ncbi:hypothetical protein THAOC_13859 [Thalassiosira oceanica]|uniref:Uncharacterized protein n=1 Tax=Thalassiosira oceanica TaxID=159749 RepID=K0SIZ8_THAOC|nr:hypothetical protein THAOC_13859 [Thalassiosira oceanica]|eukprot:EJK65295.1 hypothetical protein THAOC_13859 [Thalassiosira oceanica]
MLSSCYIIVLKDHNGLASSHDVRAMNKIPFKVPHFFKLGHLPGEYLAQNGIILPDRDLFLAAFLTTYLTAGLQVPKEQAAPSGPSAAALTFNNKKSVTVRCIGGSACDREEFYRARTGTTEFSCQCNLEKESRDMVLVGYTSAVTAR